MDLTNIYSGDDWNIFYNGYIKDQIFDAKKYNNVGNGIIRIPQKPKEYYLDEWEGWDDFLSINIKPKYMIEVQTNDHYIDNVEHNIKNIINKDKSKMKILLGSWNDFKSFPIKQLSELNKWIDVEFGIKCILRQRIKTKRDCQKYETVVLWGQREQDIFCNRIPIIIYPISQSIRFDPDISLTNRMNLKKKCNRPEYNFLPPNNMITEELNILILSSKEYIKKNKNK